MIPLTITPTTPLEAAEAICAGWWLAFDWRCLQWHWEPTPAEIDLWIQKYFM